MFQKSLSDNEATVAGIEKICNHQTKTFIIFSIILFQVLLNKYHLNVFQTHIYLNDIYINVITVIKAKTKVVFKSLFIGLTYFNISVDIEFQSQSITNPYKFQKSTIKNIHQMRGKYFLENALSLKDHEILSSKIETKFRIAILNLEFSFFRALLAKIEKIITSKRNINVATFVLFIGQKIFSHCIFGI